MSDAKTLGDIAAARPDCFEFAMEFVGDPEETEVRQYVSALEAHKRAYDNTNLRGEEAAKYCERFLKGKNVGQNLWHAILDDAIRMRKEGKSSVGSSRVYRLRRQLCCTDAKEDVENLQAFRNEVSAILGVSSPDGAMELEMLADLVKHGRDA